MLTNAGLNVDPLERRRRERRERNLERIEKATRRAERSQREQGHEAADTRFWFQRSDVFTADPVFDKSVEAVKNRTSLPVKERVILPDGSLQKVLGAAALECVQRGYFCANCEERQPDDEIRQREQLLSLERMGVSLPPGARPGTHCAYCAAPIGVQGDAPLVSPDDMTDEQREILARMSMGAA